jgi:cytochrome P450
MIVAATESNEGLARLSNDEVFANALTLLIAGEDTTAYTIAWMLYFLAKHPDIQEELREEVDAVLGSSRTLPSYAAASELRYLTALAHETLRLKGPAPLLALAAARDTQLADIALPAGTPVFALLRQVGLQPESFPEPERFEPRRWLTNDDSGQRAALARESLPFGAGPRVCPGRQVALLECAILMSAVIKSFELALPPGLEVREAFDFAMKPENLRVILRPRARAAGEDA